IIIISILSAQSVPYFDGERAMQLLEKQCEFGYRYPGAPGHEKMITFFNDHLSPITDELKVYKTPVLHPMRQDSVVLYNFLARYNPDSNFRIMLLAHWDTREIADQDPVDSLKNSPILGANDGASGVAVLLTLAEILHNAPVNYGIDLLFVDGEDMGVPGVAGSYGLGTKEVSKYLEKPYPAFAICLDMIGDKDQQFYMEYYSVLNARDVVAYVWKIAHDLGYSQFITEIGTAIEDDHLVLWKHTGIPAIDIIDFQYPNENENYWHTTSDTPDKCSAKSLEAVGSVMTELIYRENQRKHD
ncbi:MAG: M28 family peptidase, partial [Fidelibacterota bacterium]